MNIVNVMQSTNKEDKNTIRFARQLELYKLTLLLATKSLLHSGSEYQKHLKNCVFNVRCMNS